jgi:hypothetical protein
MITSDSEYRIHFETKYFISFNRTLSLINVTNKTQKYLTFKGN